MSVGTGTLIRETAGMSVGNEIREMAGMSIGSDHLVVGLHKEGENEDDQEGAGMSISKGRWTEGSFATMLDSEESHNAAENFMGACKTN